MLRIIIVGGDKRQKEMARYFNALGLNAIFYISHKTEVGKNDVLVLPIPVSRDGIHITADINEPPICLEEIKPLLKKAGLVIGGMYKNEYLTDISKRDDFAYYNAVPTAEGAISIAINNTDTTLWNSKILVCGYGRVGKILVSRLKAFKPHLFVSARKNTDFSLLECDGIKHIETAKLAQHIVDFDIVFNTVEAEIFTKEVLNNANKKTLFIELATGNAGFCKKAVQSGKIRFIEAPALPGKTAYITAGQIMAQTVINILKEKNLG